MPRNVKQKSFRNLADFTKAAKKRIFSHNPENGNVTLNAQIPDRVLISAARLIADGFNKYDARKPLPKSVRRRASRYIKEYYAARAGRYSTEVRPRKSNRSLYAQATGLSKNFKVFPMQKQDEKATIKISGKGGKRKLTVRNKNIIYNVYTFNKSHLKRKSTRNKHLQDTLAKAGKAKSYSLLFARGYLDKTEAKSPKKLEERFNEIFTRYSEAPLFVTGVQVAEFVNQEAPDDISDTLKKCPKCKRLNDKKAKRCRYCKHHFKK